MRSKLLAWAIIVAAGLICALFALKVWQLFETKASQVVLPWRTIDGSPAPLNYATIDDLNLVGIALFERLDDQMFAFFVAILAHYCLLFRFEVRNRAPRLHLSRAGVYPFLIAGTGILIAIATAILGWRNEENKDLWGCFFATGKYPAIQRIQFMEGMVVVAGILLGYASLPFLIATANGTPNSRRLLGWAVGAPALLSILMMAVILTCGGMVPYERFQIITPAAKAPALFAAFVLQYLPFLLYLAWLFLGSHDRRPAEARSGGTVDRRVGGHGGGAAVAGRPSIDRATRRGRSAVAGESAPVEQQTYNVNGASEALKGKVAMAGVFLSHSSIDKPFVEKLAIDLVNCGFPVWFDSWELDTGDSLSDRIFSGIDGATYLGIILSNNSIGSSWVKRELEGALAKEQRLGRRFILPVVIDDCEVPLSLAGRIYADFRGGYSSSLDRLCHSLRKQRVHEIPLHPSEALIPLVFSKGIYLNQVTLAERIDQIRRSAGPDLTLRAEQFVVSSDLEYSKLREKFLTRFDHLSDDPYYSREFEQQFQNHRSRIRQFEEHLIEGNRLIIQEIAIRKASPSEAVVACDWFSRMLRTSLLGRLYMTQSPDDPHASEYGKDCRELLDPGDNNLTTAQFFEVTDVVRCQVFRQPRGEYIGAWFDAESHVARECDRNLGIPIGFGIHVVGMDLLKFFVPQMVRAGLANPASPIWWDHADCWIGLS